MSAEDLLQWVYGEYGDRLCLTCSWQKQSSVLVHMVSELGLSIDVIELDTQLFFRESYETRDLLVERYATYRPGTERTVGAEPVGPLASKLVPGPALIPLSP